jgi:hypothetical protein
MRFYEYNVAKSVALGLAAIGIAFLVSILMALPLKWLWNWLMPIIFTLPPISYWQAWGLLFLSAILFNNKSKKGNNQ